MLSESLKRNASFVESVTVALPLLAMEGACWLNVLKQKPIERGKFFFSNAFFISYG